MVREVYRLFREAKEAAFAQSGAPALDPWRFGIEANRRSLEIVIDFALKQGLIPRRIAGRRTVQRHHARVRLSAAMTESRPAPDRIKLAVEDVSKTFRVRGGPGEKDFVLAVLRHVSFAVGENEIVSLVGESGCGKTTLLRIVQGLVAPVIENDGNF